jgi:hypothetical protein
MMVDRKLFPSHTRLLAFFVRVKVVPSLVRIRYYQRATRLEWCLRDAAINLELFSRKSRRSTPSTADHESSLHPLVGTTGALYCEDERIEDSSRSRKGFSVSRFLTTMTSLQLTACFTRNCLARQGSASLGSKVASDKTEQSGSRLPPRIFGSLCWRWTSLCCFSFLTDIISFRVGQHVT